MSALTRSEKSVVSLVIESMLNAMNEKQPGFYEGEALVSITVNEFEALQSAFTKVSE